MTSALELYEAVQAQVAATTARLQAEVRALQGDDRRDTPVPPHPNAAKEKAIRRRGEQDTRTALYRFAGVDLTRIDGISAGAAQLILTEVGLDLSAFPSEKHFASGCVWSRARPCRAASCCATRRPAAPDPPASPGCCAWPPCRCNAPGPHSAPPSGAPPATSAVAIFVIARKLAILVYRMLRYGQDYVDIGEVLYESRFRLRRIANLHHNAKSLGYRVVPLSNAA